jgi:hypothetical protein
MIGGNDNPFGLVRRVYIGREEPSLWHKKGIVYVGVLHRTYTCITSNNANIASCDVYNKRVLRYAKGNRGVTVTGMKNDR